ncbi:MAG: hypothetical protein FD138_4072, partial [Planctomycetota bacterium]
MLFRLWISTIAVGLLLNSSCFGFGDWRQ